MKPRFNGRFKVTHLDLNDPFNYLCQEMFVNAPCGEPTCVSLRRLTNTLREMGYDELCPTTIFAAYRLHPELYYPQKPNGL